MPLRRRGILAVWLFSANAVEVSVVQFLGEEEGVVRPFRQSMVPDAKIPGVGESALSVEGNVSFETYGAESHFCGPVEDEVEECLAIALAFEVGMDAYGTEGQNGQCAAVVHADFGMHADGLSDESFRFPFADGHDKVEFGNEGRVGAQAMQDVMFEASGTVDVPEGFADEVLHVVAFLGTFVSDGVCFHYLFVALAGLC